MSKTSHIRVAFAGMAALCLGTAAVAGEVKGSNGGEYIKGSNAAPLNGKSICAYSGLNDEYYIDAIYDEEALRTQSWGTLVSEGHIDPQDFNDPDGMLLIAAACSPNP